jgi:cytochrome c2
MRRAIIVGSGVLALALAGAAGAQMGHGQDAEELYFRNCGVCHGVVATGSSEPGPMPVRVAMAHRPGPTMMDALTPPGLRGPSRSGLDVAIAPPYGPTLRGVIGRQAGTVDGYLYSKQFKNVLQGVIWTPATLDLWITDSQAWVQGSIMFYQQPNPEVRRKIISYLESVR